MPEVLNVEQQNEVDRARQLARYRKVRDVFVETFGPPGKRTPHGALIIEELEKFCGTRKLINALDNHGATDVPRTFRQHGRCDVMQAIHDLIEWKESEHVHVNPSNSSPK